MTEEQLRSVLREMSARGFKPRPQRGETRSWRGEFSCRNEKIQVEFSLSDWDFLSYPKVRVLSGIDVKALLPHIDKQGGLCYFQTGSVVLDRYRPAASIAQCLERAEYVLERIKFDPDYRRADIEDEFEYHWLSGQSAAVLPVLLGTIRPDSTVTNYWLLRRGGVLVHALLSDDRAEALALSKALGADTQKETVFACWLFKTDVLPPVPDRMPATVKEVLTWLNGWDRSIYLNLQRILGTERRYLNDPFVSFMVKTPIGWLGFGFDINEPVAYVARKARKPANAYKQYLHTKGGGATILRLWPTDISPEFVHSRNLNFPDLKDKNVKLVGCGAIGGYIAQALVRLGAGIGKGRLTLIDPDTLEPENLGRHVLGYTSLFKSKAESLARELGAQFPISKIVPVEKSVRRVSDLFRADLVIEATGEETVSEMLNARRLDEGSKTPLMHVWILGNGEGVQALWVQGRETACYRCLKLVGPDGNLQDRFPVLKNAPVRGYRGCKAFTPYAVSAPMHAASLGVEMVADWLKTRSPSPSFRTRPAENADVRKVKNQDLTALADCVACSNAP